MNVIALQPHQARLNVTWAGRNGDLPDAVPLDATDAQLRTWVAEALRSGHVPGIPAAGDLADLTALEVDRFPASAQVPYARIFVRPKTPFG